MVISINFGKKSERRLKTSKRRESRAIVNELDRASEKVSTLTADMLGIIEELKSGAPDIKYDIEQIRERDPAAAGSLEVALLYSGFHASLAYRIAHAFHTRGYVITARAISQAAKLITGIEIHPGAEIGRGLFIDHGSGVVIGETTVIGDNCTIYQGATLGGTGKHVGKRHPTIGNNVMIGAGAKVLGPFEVGDNAKIAAGAVVLKEVPPNSTAVGIPARIITKSCVSSEQDLDQINIPDPLAKELLELHERLHSLEEALLTGKEKNKG